jgi:YgiT-type zinc finger domain-containing protein
MAKEKYYKCPVCGEKTVKVHLTTFTSFHRDKATNQEIVVENVKTRRCSNCDHRWLPVHEESRIDKIVNKRML